MKRALALVIFLAISNGRLAAQPASGDEPRVREVLETYLHGLKFNDVASFQKSFWPEAKLLFVKKNGALGQLTQQDWYKGFAQNAGKEEEGTLRIVSVEVTGVVASAKVEEIYPRETYVNYLSLLKISGEWKIVNKIFDVRRSNLIAP